MTVRCAMPSCAAPNVIATYDQVRSTISGVSPRMDTNTARMFVALKPWERRKLTADQVIYDNDSDTVTASGGSFTDSLAPLEVRVYVAAPLQQ